MINTFEQNPPPKKQQITFGYFNRLISFWGLMFLVLFAGCHKMDPDPQTGGSGKKIILKVAHNGNERHPNQKGFEKFKDVIERETKGAVEVQIFPNEQLGSEEEASQLVKLGLLSMSAASAGGGLASFVPEAELFNLPFIFKDLDHFYRVLDGPVGRKIGAAIEKKLNCIVLGYWFSGIRNVWNSKKPVLTPTDLKGLKIRVMSSPILVQTFNALGAQATPMAFGELYSALQMGVVDGGETDHIDLLYEKFHEVTKFVSYTNHMYLAVALIYSKKQFEKLPSDIRVAVRKAAAVSIKAQRQTMESLTKAALAELKEKGLKFFDIDREPFRAKVIGVYEKNAQKVGGMAIIRELIEQ